MTEWIKCSDRLPDDLERVLVYDIKLKLGMIMIFCEGSWLYDPEMELACYDNSEITHWMTLPDPPNEMD